MRARAVLFAVVVSGLTASARAVPDPVGIYALVEQTVMEPATGNAQRLQVWGAFALADRAHDFYVAPKRGYMYFACGPEDRARCDDDWADLRWHAGSGKAIGFGDRAKPLGRVRAADEPLTAPDLYPAGEAVIKMASKDYPAYTELADKLKAAIK